ncbi:S41 family peptidase [Mucilaginibacter segetis]|uniref:Tail specific protease domain-containing protein n=1 Tax=Mucilaginibacter segetis TaxID=2793071 RepID=A0A934UMP3_9SPHI|nr:S41 family peptidase [Mucilaginibacter segetis]MBK0379086.1 hypothetical protein [Mucilaginibacter segetis]
MRKIFYLILLISIVVASSCKKTSTVNPNNGTDGGNTTVDAPSKQGTTLDLIRDSVFLYAKEAYYWNDGLPTYASFKPRTYTGTDDLDALSNEVDAISQIVKNPATGEAYEYYANARGHAKYSFIDEGDVSAELNGVKGDFGFAPLYNGINDLRVKYVYPGSPADIAGIKRGYQIVSINGRNNISYDAGSGGSGANVNFVINAYAYSSNITMTLKKPDGTTFDVNMTTASYTANPVLKYQVYDLGNNKKVGYIVFNSFTSNANAKPKLDEAFTYFSSQGITDLVVDLRYNGGGYVSTAEYLSNMIVPASKDGSVMYYTYFNTTLISGNAKILKNQVRRDATSGQLYNYSQFDYSVEGNKVDFSKANVPVNLNLSNIFFIVTSSTASASELTINNLKGALPSAVKLIGSTSYGKPVGFFDIDINKYQMYIPEFETKNSLQQGGYYAGMTPGTPDYPGVNDDDDVTRDFGDPTEVLLAHALNYVKNGTFNVPGQQIQSLSNSRTMSIEQENEAAIQLDKGKFRGMIYNKPLKLKK